MAILFKVEIHNSIALFMFLFSGNADTMSERIKNNKIQEKSVDIFRKLDYNERTNQ